MAELIGGSGYDDVQDTEPSSPSIGDTWLDTNPNGDADSVGKIYADLGDGADWQVFPVQDELQSGRTRELLMLLQDKSIPEIVDPLNIQPDLSNVYATDNDGDYVLKDGDSSTASRPDDTDSGDLNGDNGIVINPNVAGVSEIDVTISSNTTGTLSEIILKDLSDGTIVATETGSFSNGDIVTFSGLNLTSGQNYVIYNETTNNSAVIGRTGNGTDFSNATSDLVDIPTGYENGSTFDRAYIFDDVTATVIANSGKVTDRFAAPTTEPADFKQWNAIQARDVTEGGSTSATPVEFDILDLSDTELNSTRIPKAQIADEPFTMRNRVYSESAGSDGQSDYQIATTGDGGHFGIPVLTVVSVKKNGSVLDSANWSFDGDTTVTIDTANVTIASGDTIDIKYDFDVFDSTLQPRAYLSRASTSETSPSISHFRYEYVI